MKKLIAAALLGLSVTSGWAQGTIDFRNGGVTFKYPAERRIFFGNTGELLVGQNWVAGLYYLPGANRGQILSDGVLAYAGNGGALARFRVPTTATPGVWLNPVEIGNLRILDGIDIGQTATLQVRVWDGNKYSDFMSAYWAGEYWVSREFNYVVPQPGSLAHDYYLNDFTSVIPEPSTLSIGLASIVGLAFAKRTSVRSKLR